MKLIIITFRNLAILLPMMVAGLSLRAAPMIVPASTNAPAQSVFTLPDSPKEGRDPFFPNSPRPYVESHQQNNTQPELSALKLEGITGRGSRALAVINGETFAAGEESDVKTAGGKIHVRCMQIKTSSVVIEASGQILILALSNP
jgi:hypothetical protein